MDSKFYDHKVALVADLIPYALNSREHSDDQVAQIAASIRAFGFTNPVLIDEQNNLIAGHGRVMAARKLKMSEVPAVVVTGLDDRKRRALIIADNKLALNASWDMEALLVEVRDLGGEFGELMGFSDDELAAMMAEETEGLTDEDAVPEVPAVPVTVEGDVWLLGRHRLMCGDSTSIDAVDKLMAKSVPNAVITDPPYGIGIDGQKKSVSANPKHNRKHHEKKGWDAERPDASIFGYIVALGVPAVIWGGELFCRPSARNARLALLEQRSRRPNHERWRTCLDDRRSTASQQDCQPICLKGKRPPDAKAHRNHRVFRRILVSASKGGNS
jgi:hypothetical protein